VYIQPLFPSVMPVGVGAVPRVQGIKARREQGGQEKPGPDQTSPIDRQDTVEISREAISQEAQTRLVGQLGVESRREVEKLKSTDRKVRAHEQAHLSAAGPYARGGPSFTYRTGPDGRQYAVGGEVGIDTSPVEGDPEATISKAQVIRAAALAPANPSAQDRSIAAAANKMETQAQQELRQQQIEEQEAGQSGEEYGGELLLAGRNRQEGLGALFDAVA